MYRRLLHARRYRPANPPDHAPRAAPMSALALALYVVALVVLFGVRSWAQFRRTGSTGFRGISDTPRDAGWWGGVLFIAAVLLGLAGRLLAVTGTVPAHPHPLAAVVGVVLAL